MYRDKYDLIVVGSGPGGFAAAIAAARKGRVYAFSGTERASRWTFDFRPAAAGLLDRAGNQVVGGIGQEIL